MTACGRYFTCILGWALMAVLASSAAAEKRLSLGLGAGLIRVPTPPAANGDQGEPTSLPAAGLGASYEWDHSLRWAWQLGADVGYGFGEDGVAYGAVDLGGVYRLDILAWVPYVRGAVGARVVAGSETTSVAPTGTAALGLIRLRDREVSWRGEVRYRLSVDVGDDANAPAHEVGLWLARTWHWDYF